MSSLQPWARSDAYSRGYRDATSRRPFSSYRDVQSSTPRAFLSDYARGWAAGIAARLFGVDLSGAAT